MIFLAAFIKQIHIIIITVLMDHQLREAWTPRAIYSIPPAIWNIRRTQLEGDPWWATSMPKLVTAINVQNNPGIHESLRI